MKFKVTRTSDFEFEGTVELNTLEDLMVYIHENGDIIITEGVEFPEIEIYDTYRE